MIHSFSTSLAISEGLEESIILHSLYCWLLKNAHNQKNFREGRYWTYNSALALSKLFPYIKKDRLYRLLKSMDERDLILRKNFNEEPMDKTLWYSISDSTLSIMLSVGYQDAQEITEMNLGNPYDFANLQNAFCKSAKAIPILDINIKEKENIIINNNIKEKESEVAKSPAEKASAFAERELKFKRECEKFASIYGQQMIERFYLYWSEPNKSKSKMRWEMEKTWDLGRRLNTWAIRSGFIPQDKKSSSKKGSDFEAFTKEFNRRQNK